MPDIRLQRRDLLVPALTPVVARASILNPAETILTSPADIPWKLRPPTGHIKRSLSQSLSGVVTIVASYFKRFENGPENKVIHLCFWRASASTTDARSSLP